MGVDQSRQLQVINSIPRSSAFVYITQNYGEEGFLDDPTAKYNYFSFDSNCGEKSDAGLFSKAPVACIKAKHWPRFLPQHLGYPFEWPEVRVTIIWGDKYVRFQTFLEAHVGHIEVGEKGIQRHVIDVCEEGARIGLPPVALLWGKPKDNRPLHQWKRLEHYEQTTLEDGSVETTYDFQDGYCLISNPREKRLAKLKK